MPIIYYINSAFDKLNQIILVKNIQKLKQESNRKEQEFPGAKLNFDVTSATEV